MDYVVRRLPAPTVELGSVIIIFTVVGPRYSVVMVS